MSSISLCTIAKDGGKWIESMFISTSKIVDEIIIVDTGSTDNTLDIAERYGAKIVKSTFNNDFSFCRNISISYATKDWILYLDCDESLYVNDIEQFKKLLDDERYVAINLIMENVIDGVGYNAGNVIRLFRNNLNFSFQGKLHEQILPSIYENFSLKNIYFSESKILHYGYNLSNDELLIKHNRNINILESFNESEKDGFYYFNLGNEFFSINDFDTANKYYSISYSMPDNNINYKVNLAYNHCRSTFELKDNFKTINLCNNYLRDYKTYADLYFIIAIAYLNIDALSLALINLQYYKKYSISSSYPNHNLDKINNIDELIINITNKIL